MKASLNMTSRFRRPRPLRALVAAAFVTVSPAGLAAAEQQPAWQVMFGAATFGPVVAAGYQTMGEATNEVYGVTLNALGISPC